MKKLFLISCIFFAPVLVYAQRPGLGFPPYGKFDPSQFDSVNLENLNVVFTIPIVSIPGRGMPTNVALTYNTSFWSAVPSGYGPIFWDPGPGFQYASGGQPGYGWNLGIGPGGVTYDAETLTCDADSQTTGHYFNFRYIETDGTTHIFTGADFYDNQTACNYSPLYSGTDHADDGSGLYIISDSNFSTVYSPAGTKLAGYQANPYDPKVYDRNGNYRHVSPPVTGYTTQYYDSVGRLTLTMTEYSDHFDYIATDSNGISQTYTLNIQNFYVKTNFACPNVQEYSPQYPNPNKLPVSFVLPNGRSYAFTYEDTPGYPGWTTARLKRVTLPTGGYYEYVYPNTGNNGMYCATLASTLASFTRNINDGTSTQSWSYNIAGSKTKVTPPQLPYDTAPNESTYTFTNLPYPNSQQIDERYYQGLETSNQLLREVTTIKSVDHRPVSVTVTLENNQQSKTETDWNADNQLLEKREFDWGTGAPGPLLRRTTYTYLSTAPYANQGIRDRITQKIIKDGAGNVKYRTDIAYDESGKINTSCPTGVPGHDDANYGCTYTTRGNPTSVTVYTDPVTPSGGITKGSTYDWFGNVLTTQVNSVVQNQLNFSSVTQYAFPTSVVRGPSGGPQLTTGATYNPYTSQVTTTTDENGQVTTFTYADPGHMNRLTDVQRPDSQHVTYAYDDIAQTVAVTSPVQTGTSIKQISYFDGLGRKVKQQITDGGGTSYSIIESQFDSIGRPYKTSNPHNSTAQYWTEVRFDGLGRPTVSIPPGGTATSNNTSYAYSGATVTVTDPAGKQKKSQSDGLGRLITLYEPDVTNGNQLTQQTSYTYGVLDQLTQVSEGAQTRTYTYDGLVRLQTVQLPETNQVQATYAYNNYGLITQRADARGVVTTYSYDTLNRVYNVSYNVGSTGVPATPTVTFTFGTNSSQNNNGRLISMTDGVGSESYTYDILGRVTQQQKVIGTSTYTTQYTYNYAGEPAFFTYPSGRVVQPNYDAIGRLCSVGLPSSTCSTGTTYSTAYAYNAANQITGLSYGNGVTASFGYSPDRLQLTSLSYVKSPTTLFSLSYGYTQNGGNNGQITNMTDNTGTQEAGRSATYTYDALYRLSSAVTTGSTSYPQWGLSFAYDRYGNRTSQSISSGCVAPMTCPTNSLTFSSSGGALTNRPDGMCFDANGNLTAESGTCPPGNPNYTYDAENRLVSYMGTGGTYTYDGNGLRVKKAASGTTTVYIFSGSKVIAEYDNGAAPTAPSREYIYSGGALLAKIESGASTYYHPDHLSNRVLTDSNGNTLGQRGHYPFGETWYESGTITKLKFTTYERDPETAVGASDGNDYAMARFYISRFGRFSSVDPLAGDISNPQSLNRYAYASNNPTNLTDPSGLCDDNCKGRNLGTVYNGSVGGHCVLDHIDAECNAVFVLIRQGAAARCPNNNCTGLQLTNEGWKKWTVEGFIRADYNCYDDFDNCRLVGYKQSWRWLLTNAGPVDENSLEGTILERMLDPNQCPDCNVGRTFSSASDWVTAGTIYTAGGVGTVVAAPTAVAGYSATSDILLELEAGSPGTMNATADVIRSLLSPMSSTLPSTPGGFLVRAILWFRMLP